MDLACLKHLSVIVVTQFATNEQLKDLTHMFCLQIPCYKLYKQGFISYVFTLKYMCHFGMSKKLNLKAKHKINLKNSWLFLMHLLLCFPTYLTT